MDLLVTFRLIYLVGSAFALFFCFLIFSKKNKTIADKILGWWLVILFGQLIIPTLYLTNLNLYYNFAGIEIIFYVFHPLFLNLYVKATIGQLKKWKGIGWHIAAIVFYELFGLSFFLIPASERLLLIEGKELLPLYFIPFVIFIAGYFAYLIFSTFKLLKNYKDNVLQVYSYRENVDLLWLRRLLGLFATICLLIFPLGLFSYYGLHSMAFTDYYFFVTLVIFIFFLGFWGYQQGEVFNISGRTYVDNEENSDEPPVENHIVEKHYKAEAVQLKDLMKDEKLYLNPTLSIHDLADSMKMPAHQLSKVINKEFHCNFFEFVNKYRIEEFKQRAYSSDYKNMTILAIALDCGFNSKSAFNRIFKDMIGLTPGDYIKHHKH
ncbi:MAG: AraC family transcriptional regulator [Paludibacter sp.]|nr:AraC family transcriptional regulator [Paludibacter sp.]